MATLEATPVLDLALETLLHLDPEQLTPNPRNPRRDLGDLADLEASIRDKGVLEPLLCLPNGTVVCGHRRRAAAILAGVEVPVLVRELTEAEQIETMLTENLQRSDITPLEEAQAYQELLDLGVDLDLTAQRVGVREERIRRRTALLSLPNLARALLESGVMTMAAAEELLKLRDHPEVMQSLVEDEAEHASPQRPIAHFWGVDGELARIRNAAARAKGEETAKAQGLKVVKLPDAYNSKSKNRAVGKGYHQVDVPPKAHAKLKCHAVAITETGTLQAVCTRPANHPEAAAEATPASGHRSDYQAARLAAEERKRQRLAIITEALQGDPGPAHALTKTLLLTREGYWSPGELCKVLEVPVPDDAPDQRAALAFAEWIMENAPQPIRFNRAVAAAILLEEDRAFEDGDESLASLHYAAWLHGRGYELPSESDDGYVGWEVRKEAVVELTEAIAKDPRRAYAGTPTQRG